MKIEKSPSSKFGFALTGDANPNIPDIYTTLEDRCKELYGPNSVEEIAKAANMPSASRLQMIMPLSLAIGYALHTGKTASASDNALLQAGIARAEALRPKPAAPVSKSFPEIVRVIEQSRMVSKGTAVGLAAKEFPTEHREWLMSGQTERL